MYMPSKTVYFPDGVYEFASDTRDTDGDDEESIGQRLAVLAEKGVEAEREGILNE